jgi:predicted 3-demethylubiquinone-9 3-methyltransferase (glyoxalase superfamily)
MTEKPYPCLWFNQNAREAADYYCSIFPDSKIIEENPMVVIFEINGMKTMGLNGGPHFKFNESVSLVINCDSQEEIDYYWNTLTSNGGSESQCGWLKDKFGFSWQIVPNNLGKLLSSGKNDAMEKLMAMKKIIIADLL